MALSPEGIDAMLAAGCTAEQIGAIIKAELAAEAAKKAAAEEERKAKAREGNRERQARWRQRNANNAVTLRDERDPSPKDINQTPTQPTPSVGSDEPTAPKGADDVADDGQQGGGKGAETKRTRRIPDDFSDSPEARAVCAEMGFVGREADEVLAEFCDFWMSEGGPKARKLDWCRTLRNRLREVGRRRPSARASPTKPRSTNGYFDFLRSDMGGDDDRGSEAHQHRHLRIAGGRQ